MPDDSVTHARGQDLLVRGLLAIARVVPRGLATGIGGALGRAGGLFAGRKRSRVRENLARAGASDPDSAARAAWASLGTTFAEMLWTAGQDPKDIAAALEIEGLEHFVAAHQRRQGTLCVSAHAANWELTALAASRSGVPSGVVAREMRAPGLEERLTAFRDRAGIRTLVRGRPGSSVAAVRLLKTGGVLGCMMDRISAGERLAVPFLGRATQVPMGPVDLALRTGSQVVAGCARRQADGRTRVGFRVVSPGTETDRIALARTIGRALEEDVRQAPEQWLWITRRQPEWTGTSAPIVD